MDKLEKVEKLREKTGVSYADAKDALEANEYDMLDAIVYLEKAGKINDQQSARYETHKEAADSTTEDFAKAQQEYEKSVNSSSIGDVLNKFFDWCGKVLKKSVENSFIIHHKERQVIKVPVLILALALIFAFWVTVPLLVLGLFCNCRYHFEGIDSVTININEMCDKAADSVDEAKDTKK